MVITIHVPEGTPFRGEHLLLEAFEKGASSHCISRHEATRGDGGHEVIVKHARLGIIITTEGSS